MVSRRGLTAWGRGSRISDPATETPRRGATRREVFALPTVGLAASAAQAQGLQVAQAVPGGYVIALGDHRWTLEAAALGLSQLSSPTVSGEQVTFDIPNATWPGTQKTFRLVIIAGPDPAKPDGDTYSVGVTAPALGWQGVRGFGAFLAGAPLGGGGGAFADAATDAAAGLGWAVRPGARALWLLPDLSWRLQTAGGFDHALGVVRSDAVRLRGYAAGRSPLSAWTKAVTVATTAATAEGVRVRPRGKLRCGETAKGDRIVLRADQLAEAVSSTTATRDIAHALSGEWRTAIRRGAAGGATTFTSVNGLVLIDGAKIAAMMPLAAGQQVRLSGATAQLDGKRDTHRIAVRSDGGRVLECSIRGLLVRLAVRLEDVDYSQFEFDEQEVLLLLDDVQKAGDFTGATFTLAHWARWRLPLQHARLRLARARDNFSLTYTFHEMVLVQRLGGWKLEAARGAQRPIFVANLPPQHVLEEAFFRQVQTGPNPPLPGKAPLDIKRVLDDAGNPVDPAGRRVKQDPDVNNTNANNEDPPSRRRGAVVGREPPGARVAGQGTPGREARGDPVHPGGLDPLERL